MHSCNVIVRVQHYLVQVVPSTSQSMNGGSLRDAGQANKTRLTEVTKTGLQDYLHELDKRPFIRSIQHHEDFVHVSLV